jgi:tRNA dimethylallyltransferase
MNKEIPHVLVILGATACGKTRLACRAAFDLDGEIISADSRQIYRYMDIGTGKDLNEYNIGDTKIPYHLIDIKDPGYKYNIAEFQNDFLESMLSIHANGKTALLCGGSGLYISTALKGNSYLGIPMDKELGEQLELKSDKELAQIFESLSSEVKSRLVNTTRARAIRAIIVDDYLKVNPDFQSVQIPAFDYTIVGIDVDRETRRKNISQRLSYRMNHGLIEEVQGLLDNYLNFQDLDYYGLEYKWVGRYLSQKISKKELFEGLEIAIHQFAKRQMTWFRRMEKNGYKINWVDAAMSEAEKISRMTTLYHDKNH